MRTLINLIIISILIQISAASNAEPITFRIGTGGSAGTYYPIGSLISQSITQANIEQISRENRTSNVVAIAQRSNGSVANVNDIENGLLEGALSQADVAYWAYHATGPFTDNEPNTSLRTIASLYLESIHLVVRSDSGINSVTNLVGRRVSIDEIGSGTLSDVKLVLSAYDIELSDINPVYLKLKDSIDRLRNNELDAFIFVAGYPVQQIVDIVNEGAATVIPIQGNNLNSLVDDFPFFSVDTMPAGIYKNASEVVTLAVAAQFIVSASLGNKLVYDITKTLWSEQSAKLLTSGHPKGRAISIENAITGVSIPLHPGAKQFYEEQSIDTSNIPNEPSN